MDPRDVSTGRPAERSVIGRAEGGQCRASGERSELSMDTPEHAHVLRIAERQVVALGLVVCHAGSPSVGSVLCRSR